LGIIQAGLLDYIFDLWQGFEVNKFEADWHER